MNIDFSKPIVIPESRRKEQLTQAISIRGVCLATDTPYLTLSQDSRFTTKFISISPVQAEELAALLLEFANRGNVK